MPSPKSLQKLLRSVHRAMASSSDHTTRTYSPQCPICHGLMKEPKLLTCSHTFCKQCLALLHYAQRRGDSIICPVCQSETKVPEGKIQDLRTNVKSLLNDVDDTCKKRHCSVCDEGKRVPVVSFCEECNTYMCVSCQQKHGEWKLLAKHRVVKLEDVGKGTVTLNKQIPCQGKSHHEKDPICTEVCIDCRKSVCLRCRMEDHEKKSHKALTAEKFAAQQKEGLKILQRQADRQVEIFERRINKIDSEIDKVNPQHEKIVEDITKAHRKAIRILREKKARLLRECSQARTSALDDLQASKSSNEKMLTSGKNLSTLVNANMKEVNGVESADVNVRKYLKEEVKALAEEPPPADTHTPLSFVPDAYFDDPRLGSIHATEWRCNEVPAKRSILSLASTPDGQMAAGTPHGILLFSAEGKLERTMMHCKKITGLHYLSDGRLVVCDDSNVLSLYTSDGKKMHVNFETLTRDAGGYCRLAVDRGDHIFVSYSKARKILVFTMAGGKPVREVVCLDHYPSAVCCVDSFLLATCCKNQVRVMNELGDLLSILQDPGTHFAKVAVGQDGSIFIAGIEKVLGLVRIVRVSRDLVERETVVNLREIEDPFAVASTHHAHSGRYNLQVFKNGDVAFSTHQKLFIFRENMVPVSELREL